MRQQLDKVSKVCEQPSLIRGRRPEHRRHRFSFPHCCGQTAPVTSLFTSDHCMFVGFFIEYLIVLY